MLSKLYIQNFALIDQLSIDFGQGLQVITGETGAGKSIILGALRLLLGDRTDTKTIADPKKKSIVEGNFKINDSKLADLFKEHDLDFEKETVIRREISATGKSRAFINDTPVNLTVLKEISENLIDIHSQFETSNLFQEAYQIGILDGVAGNQNLLEKYRFEYAGWNHAKSELNLLKKRMAENNKEADYHQYLLQELQKADLDGLNLEELQSQLNALENAGLIRERLSESTDLLDQEESGVLDLLNHLQMQLSQVGKFSPTYEELSERVQSAKIELQDVAQIIEKEEQSIEDDPERMSKLLGQINRINSLLQKHQQHSVEDLIEIRENLLAENDSTEALELKIKELDRLVSEQEASLKDLATKLTSGRKPAISRFEKSAGVVLKRLGLEKARLEIQMRSSEGLNELGQDKVQILFQANTGYPLRPVKEAISGGERSRVMFAIKKIMAESQQLPTLILDEIDTGISGRVADEMGLLMKEMGNRLQLIVITHLAQIAAKGDENYKVYKTEIQGKTQSTIVRLKGNEKINEIAQLLSGHKVTNAAIEQAKSLIG